MAAPQRNPKARRSDRLTQQILRRDSRVSLAEDAASDQAVELFEKALGGRDALLDALAVGDNAPEVNKVVTLLVDPRYETYSLRKLCHDSGITVADLFAAFKQAAVQKAHLLASQVILSRLLPVVEDVMTRSAPHYVTCEACDATGTITPEPTKTTPNPEPAPCTACKGRGQRLVFPDLDRQKLALELADLVKKGGGLSITQNNAAVFTPSAVSTGSLEQLQQALGERWKAPSVIDAVAADLQGDAAMPDDSTDAPDAPTASGEVAP